LILSKLFGDELQFDAHIDNCNHPDINIEVDIYKLSKNIKLLLQLHDAYLYKYYLIKTNIKILFSINRLGESESID